MAKVTGIGLLGCGTVGTAVAEALTTTANPGLRAGLKLELRRVLVRNARKKRGLNLPAGVLTTEGQTVVTDPKVEIVVELLGGLEPARTLVLAALAAGKHVVTANKYLLAVHGREIFAAARAANRCVAFEASCGGAIPIIGALLGGLAANDITQLVGIVNGTCNYILTQMTRGGQSYATALAGAQAAGYAEPDPTFDVNGTDSAHKLAVLAALAFGGRVDLASIACRGIDTLQDQDLRYGKELGYICKLLAIADKTAGGVSLQVRPTWVPADHPLANVHGSYNAIMVEGSLCGTALFYGRGAGPKPTASAVLGDVLEVALGVAPARFANLPRLDWQKDLKLVPSGKLTSRNYLRVTVRDVPGVLAKVTRLLGTQKISISAVVQHETNQGQFVPVVIVTHAAPQQQLDTALKAIDRLPEIGAPTVCMPVLS